MPWKVSEFEEVLWGRREEEVAASWLESQLKGKRIWKVMLMTDDVLSPVLQKKTRQLAAYHPTSYNYNVAATLL